MNVGLDPDTLTLLCEAFLWGLQASISKQRWWKVYISFPLLFLKLNTDPIVVTIVESQHVANRDHFRTASSAMTMNPSEGSIDAPLREMVPFLGKKPICQGNIL